MKKIIFVILITVFVIVSIKILNSKQIKKENRQTSTKPPQNGVTANKSTRYVSYSSNEYELYRDRKRVLFFHAVWCPTCKIVNEELTSNPDKIPQDVIVFKTDYDTEKELKQKYNITYQHTFVLVDDKGNEIKKWNGGGIAEIIYNTI